MRIEHDKEANAIYVYMSDAGYHHGNELDPDRRVDYALDGSAIGIEFLNVSQGVDVRDLPSEDQLVQELEKVGVKVLSRSR